MNKIVTLLRSRSTLFSRLSNPVTTAINTTVSNSLSADGLTWSQANPIVFDAYGNIIVNLQRNSDGRRVFTFSNDDGATWQDNTGINDLSNLGEIATRVTFCYDSTNDCLHGLLYYNSDVVVYRKYRITRSGTNIVSIDWLRGTDANTVLQSTSATGFEHPIIYKTGSHILCVWSVKATSGSDIIAVRCNIGSNANAGATLTNWVHIGISSTSTIGSIPDTPTYTVLATTAITADMYPSLTVLANGDLAYVYYKSSAYYIRRATWNGSAWNALTTETLLCNVKIAGTDTGYALKYQLITRIIESGTTLYVGFPVWLSNAAGDTQRICAINSSDVATFYDVYSANGAHAYAPTLDITYIDTRLVVAYLKTTNDTYVRVFTGIIPLTAETLMVSSSNPIDIPLLADRKVANKLFSVYRIAGTPPQVGKYTTMDFSA